MRKLIPLIALLLCACAPALGAQNTSFDNTQYHSGATSGAAFASISEFTADLYAENVNWADDGYLAQHDAGFALVIFSNRLYLQSGPEGFAGVASISVAGRSADQRVRVRRKVGATYSTWVLEMWDADGTGYVHNAGQGASVAAMNWSAGTVYVGLNTTAEVAFLRSRASADTWSVYDYDPHPPEANAHDAGRTYLYRYEFEGNAQDSGPNARHLTTTGSPTYTTTTADQAPIAHAGRDQTAKPGATVTLDARRTFAAASAAPTCTVAQTAGTSVTVSEGSECLFTFTAPTPSGDSEQLSFTVTATAASVPDTDTVDAGIVKVGPNDIVTVSDAKWAFLVGPQIMSYSSLIPDVARFEWKLEQEGEYWGGKLPAVPPTSDGAQLAGTATITNGSAAVVGVGTTFLSDIQLCDGAVADYFCENFTINGVSYRVLSVTDDTHLTLRTNATGSGTFEFTTPANGGGDYINHSRYDMAKIFYQQYTRSGLEKWRTLARKVADSWWRSPYHYHGTVLPGGGPNWPPAYNNSVAGQIMRAHDSKPERFDYLYRAMVLQFDASVYAYRTSGAWPGPLFPGDPRDVGWTHLWFVLIVNTMPTDPATYTLYGNGTHLASTGTDTYTTAERNADIAKSDAVVSGVWERLQYATGEWRWDTGGGCGANPCYAITQPYMMGIAMEALVKARELTSDSATDVTALAVVKDSLDYLESKYLKTTAVSNWAALGFPAVTYWRGIPYFTQGGHTAGGTQYVGNGLGGCDANLVCSTGVAPGLSDVRGWRLHQAFFPFAAGYYYSVTGDETYKARGDEYADSIWGGGTFLAGGSSDDGIQSYGTSDSIADKQKDFAEAYNQSMPFFAYRVSVAQGTGRRMRGGKKLNGGGRSH